MGWTVGAREDEYEARAQATGHELQVTSGLGASSYSVGIIRAEGMDEVAYSLPVTIAYDPDVSSGSDNQVRAVSVSRNGQDLVLRWSLHEQNGTSRREYTGHERDEETGLDYMMARYKQTCSPRFTSPDPIFDTSLTAPTTWNRYGYVHGDPVNAMDPSGTQVPRSLRRAQEGADQWLEYGVVPRGDPGFPKQRPVTVWGYQVSIGIECEGASAAERRFWQRAIPGSAEHWDAISFAATTVGTGFSAAGDLAFIAGSATGVVAPLGYGGNAVAGVIAVGTSVISVQATNLSSLQTGEASLLGLSPGARSLNAQVGVLGSVMGVFLPFAGTASGVRGMMNYGPTGWPFFCK